LNVGYFLLRLSIGIAVVRLFRTYRRMICSRRMEDLSWADESYGRTDGQMIDQKWQSPDAEVELKQNKVLPTIVGQP